MLRKRDVLGGKHGHYSAQAGTNYTRTALMSTVVFGRVALEPCDLHTAAKRCTRADGAAVAGREQWQCEQWLASRENTCLN